MLNGIKAFNGLEVEQGVVATCLDIEVSLVNELNAYAVILIVKYSTEEELAKPFKEFIVLHPEDFSYNPTDEPYRVRKVSRKEGTTETTCARSVIKSNGG